MRTDIMQDKMLSLFGVASCLGAQNQACHSSPYKLADSGLISTLQAAGISAQWQHIMSLDNTKASNLSDLYQILADQIQQTISTENSFVVIGGDHSCAIGTWSGAALGLQRQHKGAELGLIWIDAHMDAHTPETSPSGALHGMPVACLLGHGKSSYCNIGFSGVKVKPENLCLIGVRSYEKEEAELLRQAGVRVYFIDEVNRLGLNKIMQQALVQVSQHTRGFGVSIDMDCIDPTDAPGVGSPEKNGLLAKELLPALSNLVASASQNETTLIGIEITELNPERDIEQRTQILLTDIILSIFGDS